MDIEQRLDLERDNRRHESTQARLTGRLKSACCHRCGSNYGMQKVHRETLTETVPPVSWYKEPGNTEYLFYPCSQCNHWRIIPDGFTHVSLDDIQAWLDRDPMQPGYAALAESKPVLASEMDRDSAGL